MKKNISYSKQFIFSFLIVSLLLACNSSSTKNKTTEEESGATIKAYRKPLSGYTDTLIINRSAAIFFNVDSVQLAAIKTMLSNRNYENDVHDCFYQMRNARIVLAKSWPQVPIQEAVKIRYLLFIKKDNNKTLIDIDSRNDMCGIYLFNAVKEPEWVDMTNIDTALEQYFK
jgi:hypothetical protein